MSSVQIRQNPCDRQRTTDERICHEAWSEPSQLQFVSLAEAPELTLLLAEDEP
jgi:hypothetical protein